MLGTRHSHLWVSIVLLLVLTGCMGVGEKPPENTPIPSATFVESNDDTPPTATPALVAVAERTVVDNGDGTVTQSLKLSNNTLGIGEVLVRAPANMTTESGGYVTLTLFPSGASTGGVIAPVTDTGTMDGTQSTSASTSLYPIMMADLTGMTFDIDMDGEAQRLITTDAPTEWLWSIQPRSTGEQRLIASLSIPVEVEGSSGTTTRVVNTFPIAIQINKTFAQTIEENMDVLLPMVLGVLGGGVTLGWRTLWNRRKAE